MPQQISRKGIDNLRDPIWIAILEAMAGTKLSNDDSRKLVGEPGDEFITVSFVVNDVELNFEAVIKQFNDQYSRLVTEQAYELLREKFLKKLQDTLDQLRDTIDSAANTLEDISNYAH